MAEQELSIDTSSARPAKEKQRRVRIDDSNMKSAYSNVFNAHENPNEVVLTFGFTQNPAGRQRNLQVELLHQVILHPVTARQLKDALVGLFNKRDARRSRAAEQKSSGKKDG